MQGNGLVVLCFEVPRQSTAVLLCHGGQAEGRAEGLPLSQYALAESPRQAKVKPSWDVGGSGLSLLATSTKQVTQNQGLGSTHHPASCLFEE